MTKREIAALEILKEMVEYSNTMNYEITSVYTKDLELITDYLTRLPNTIEIKMLEARMELLKKIDEKDNVPGNKGIIEDIDRVLKLVNTDKEKEYDQEWNTR